MKRNMALMIGAGAAAIGSIAALSFWRMKKAKKMNGEKEIGFNHKSAPTEAHRPRIGV